MSHSVRIFAATIVLGAVGTALAKPRDTHVRSAQSAPHAANDGGASVVLSASTEGGLPVVSSVAPEGMLLVPGGTFAMGNNVDGEGDERPMHNVTVESYYLDRTEVTNEAYQRCVSAHRCVAPDPRSAELNHLGDDRRFRRPQQPVSSIDWSNARAYCVWIGKRLPTEAEFERASRGDDGRRFPWGNERPTPRHSVYGSSVSQDVGTHPLGAGPYGHLDLNGNVWEWIEDRYDPYAYRRPTAPQGRPGTCREILRAQNELRAQHRQGFTGANPIPTECERVLRGGAFNYDIHGLRSSNRVHHPGQFRLVMSGFRCAKSL